MLDQKHNLAQLARPSGVLLVETAKNTLQLSKQQVSRHSVTAFASPSCEGSMTSIALQMPCRCKPLMI